MSRQSLLIFVILSTVTTVANAQFTNEVKLWNNLQGKVKTCTTIGYNIRKGDTASKRIYIFDSVVFDNKGQVIKTFKSNTVRGADINKRIFTSYEYDSKGNLIGQLYHDFDGKAEAKLVYNYSRAKKLIMLKIYFLKEKDSSRVSDSYKVDAAGRVLEKYHYNESFVPDVKCQYVKTVYKYNAKGARIEELEYDLNGLEISKRFSKYDQNNQMLETAFIWIKDERANEAMSFTYTRYDKHHNWLVRNRIIHGKLHSVNERRITYYK